MEVRGRRANPLRVHQIWDAIQTSNKNGMSSDQLTKATSTMFDVPKEVIVFHLEQAVKDGLVVAKRWLPLTQSHPVTYHKPNIKEFVKGRSDWYCFKCHYEGEVVMCRECPRVYHLDCLSTDRRPTSVTEYYICVDCHTKAVNISAENLKITNEDLNALLGFVCDDILKWKISLLNNANGKIWARAIQLKESDWWRYDLLIHTPMDITTLLKKTQQSSYTSFEEFYSDCQILFHTIKVYFGEIWAGKEYEIGSGFIKEVEKNIEEIKMCPDCFRRSHERKHPFWFSLPCVVPHEIVWAKQPGFSYWPAKVMQKTQTHYDVRYFGGKNERGVLDSKFIKPLNSVEDAIGIRGSAGGTEAYQQLLMLEDIKQNPTKAEEIMNRDLPPPKILIRVRRRSSSRGSKESFTSLICTTSKNSERKRLRLDSPSPNICTIRQSRSVDRQKFYSEDEREIIPIAKKFIKVEPDDVSVSKVDSVSGLPPVLLPSDSLAPLNDVIPTPSEPGTPETVTASMSPVLSLNNNLSPLIKENRPKTLADMSKLLDFLFSELDDNLEGKGPQKNEISMSKEPTATCSTTSTEKNCSQATATVDDLCERILNYKTMMEKHHEVEIADVKRKTWCFNCLKEACYFCCWNSQYCSVNCQHQDWAKGHHRECRHKLNEL